MTLVTRTGTLLRSHPYSETSRILRVLTPGAGVVSLIAKGARSRSSKGGAPMDLFDELEITYRHRSDRDLHTLHDVRSVRRRRELGADLLRFSGASFLAELILAHTLEEDNPRLHDRLAVGLDALLEAPRDARAGVLVAAGWGLMGEFGFPPALEHCVRCHQPIPTEGLARFDLGAGGLRCPSCGSGAGPSSSPAGPRLGPEARVDLAELVAGRPPVPLRGAREHFRLLERFALYHLDRRSEFKSASSVVPLLESAGDGEIGEGEDRPRTTSPGPGTS